jgi:hypothetical protein
MEYYDSVENKTLYSHYSQRNIALLTNSEVTEILDKNGGVDFSAEIDLFATQKPAQAKKSVLFELNDSQSHYNFNNSKGLRKSLLSDLDNKSTATNKRANKDMIRKAVKQEIEKYNTSLKNVDLVLKHEIDSQMNNFNEKRKYKIEKQEEKLRSRKSRQFIVRRGSKLDDILIAAVSEGTYDDTNKNEIIKSIYELSEKKFQSSQAIMMKEIEDYIDKSMSEMHMALEELRFSYEDELRGLDGII